MTSTSAQHAAPWTIDADRWPDVAVAAGSPVRAAVARALFNTGVARLPLRVRLPDGRLFGAGGPAAPVMILHRPRQFFRRFGASGLIGFGESYMAGDWDCADLTGLLTVFAAHVDDLVPPWLQRLRALAVRRQPPGDVQTIQGARRNISRHYDLSNDLFALFLDETMTYSAAIFTEPDGAPVEVPDTDGAHLLADTYTWIHKYIFPGGLLPSLTAIDNSLTRATRLRITAREDFGAHYGQTLRIWRERFAARADEVARLGFDEVFNRMWNFYLCYSEAGFRAGYIGVSQLTLARI